jgi:hypothetical protein
MMEAALEATRLTMLPEEIERIPELRRKGRNFEYIAEEFCVSDKVIRRELRASGHSTARVKCRRAIKRPGGHGGHSMRLNKIQQKALLNIYQGNPDDSLSYWHFRHRVFPLIGEPQVAMLRYCGMTVGIEVDGFVHS